MQCQSTQKQYLLCWWLMGKASTIQVGHTVSTVNRSTLLFLDVGCLRRQLGTAWDLAFSWVADEPASHHPAMPVSVLLAIFVFGYALGLAC